jgi:hypothetical protein
MHSYQARKNKLQTKMQNWWNRHRYDISKFWLRNHNGVDWAMNGTDVSVTNVTGALSGRKPYGQRMPSVV